MQPDFSKARIKKYPFRFSLDRFFHISERKSSFSKEILSGLLIFFSMIYIIPVNSSIMAVIGIPESASFIAISLVSFICSMLAGLVAKIPLALSTAMGVNAYLAYSVGVSMGFSLGECLGIVIVSGILFFIISVTKLRMYIINLLPKSIKQTITAGLGLFILFVGLQMGGIIVSDPGTLVKLNSLNPANGNGYVLLSLLGIVLVFVFSTCKIKVLNRFNVIFALLITALLGGILDLLNVPNMPSFVPDSFSFISSFNDFKNVNLIGYGSITSVLTNPKAYGVIVSVIIVHMFGTTAPIISAGDKIGLIDKKTDKLINYQTTFFVDGVSCLIGGSFSTSPVGYFVESNVGINFGGRTGLSSVITSLGFLLCIFIYPAFNVFLPINVGDKQVTPVTCLSLVMIGGLMFSSIKDIEWNDFIVVLSSCMLLIMMVLTYSLTDGIAIGLILYVVMMLCSKRYKELNAVIYVLAGLFILNFVINSVLK